MKKAYLIIIVSMVFQSVIAQGTFKFGTFTNPGGHTVKVDSRGFIIDGHYTIPVMGEIHYSRVPASEWRREIRKMKAGGITVLSTYVFWIHHEAEEGKWDWSGNRNLHRFLEICKEENMPVILRVGPFCHGEVYQGGFPDWVVAKALTDPKQYKLRSEAPGFIAATQRLFSNIYAQVNDMQWKNGGIVIGMQLENECRGPWSYYMRLKDMALRIGFDLPFYTRTGWPKLNGKEEFGKLLPLYGDYADGFWDRVLTDMPGDYPKAFIMKDSRMSTVIATETFTKKELQENIADGQMGNGKVPDDRCVYPYLTCELGGGMMPSYHRRINISGKEIMPLAICKLGSGSNLPGYYMYHGGTNPYNPVHTMAETQATSVTNYNDMPYITYDFQSPLGEMGQINEIAFHESRWLHQFLVDWGEELAVMGVDSLSDNYAQRGCFVFRNDYIRILNEAGCASVTPIGMKWNGLQITSSTVQPFAKADGGLYFIPVKNVKACSISINGKPYNLKFDKSIKVQGKTITLLSYAKAKTAFVIDGKMCYARNGGILYKAGNDIVEESWKYDSTVSCSFDKRKEYSTLREVVMGSQKVAAMPSDSDFNNAQVWKITIDKKTNVEDYFVEIDYVGDVARVYADGCLVEDNFWNGKPMLVRLSDIIGKDAELRVLPLSKEYPIYLQKEQRTILDASNEPLCNVKSIRLIKRETKSIQIEQ